MDHRIGIGQDIEKEEKQKLKIVSNGDGRNTNVYLGDKKLNGKDGICSSKIVSANVKIEGHNLNTVILIFKDVDIDIEIENDHIELKPLYELISPIHE